MKKRYYLGALLSMAVVGSANAQSMSEDFESYTVGSYMGTNSAGWTTWSGTTGGAEDTQVTDAQAASGTKSIYFQTSSANGGPQDVIVPFGGQHTTGHFVWSANFFVDPANGAYFNFQGNTTVGQLWTFNCQMHNNGTIYFDDGATLWASTSYPQNQWFNLEVDVDLNTNSWDISMDGTSIGIFQAANNQVASIDLFPVNASNGGNNNASYYVDDFNYTHTAYTPAGTNASAYFIENIGGVAGSNITPTVTIKNLGTTAITSFDLEVAYNGNTITENITGVNVASLATYTVDFTNTLTLIGGANNIVATVSNVNGGGADDNPADDSKTLVIDPVVPAAGKMVVGEEGTGTWCQWCPRGAVFMDYMEDTYGQFWEGIAVHNGDPMVVTDYDAGIGGLIAGYPAALVDRGNDIDPSEMEAAFVQRIVTAPNAYITNGAEYNSGTNELKISVGAEFLNTLTGNWKIAVALTEDGVTGTTGYAQSNAYAGGSNGEMGGYELLPNPVPASQMVYDHVAREIIPGFNGLANTFPTMNAGEIYVKNFTTTLDPSWDVSKMHIVAMLINPSGDIDNAAATTIDEAILHGFLDEGYQYATNAEFSVENNIAMYPNPATENTAIYINGLDNDEVIVQIFDMNGKLVFNNNYGTLTGSTTISVNTETFEAGIYSVQTIVGSNQKVSKLTVK
ncbi:Omp28-related outer membrane protein [Paracrocinitomix mangrovi]|uniref:T9SS type A sorting domain-containing protein n=1 Tax=Paracrocinitomix mangrovi TaxID=2862509 RepID=UPI001C8E8E0A|nr:Omp28-related outer membrane protein [Paracrocinitomix mangrovi]UKN02082.1 Omp28-related outer membrane protein [Paracrocinitomix mangrovi]